MKTALRILIPFILLGLSALIAFYLYISKPPLKSQQPPPVIPTVSTLTAELTSHSPPVHTFGTVRSFFETSLTPQVSGQITEITSDFRVGNRVKKGTILAQIDKTDYEAILARESATLINNERTLAEEVIRGEQARADWKASGRNLETASPFVLREPQLAAASAAIASSKAAIQKAQTDIERCTLIAPFDAIITARSASLGNFASAQTSLGSLVATDHAELRLPLTPEQASRITLPNNGEETAITLTSPTKPEATWNAQLVRTDPLIDPRNQVVFVIAEIHAPYDAEEALPVGTFVNAVIPAKSLENTLRIPETALINDSFVWMVDGKSKLLRAHATRLYSHQNFAYIQLSDETLPSESITIVSRPLTSFKTGMKVIIDQPNK